MDQEWSSNGPPLCSVRQTACRSATRDHFPARRWRVSAHPPVFKACSVRSGTRTTARIGGLALHAYGDSDAIAARARGGLEDKFVREALEIDPTLDGEALETKVKLLKRLHYTRLGHRSGKARRGRRTRTRKGGVP